MAEQLGLDLPSKPALGREDFLVAPSNALAVALIDTWPDWQARKLVLTGPEGAGKTHLLHVWASRSEATIIEASQVAEADIPELANAPVAVENVPQIGGDAETETALFHLHNLTLANGQSLMFTGDLPLAGWPLDLPDLKSRLQGATSAQLDPPDDTLLAAVLTKQFADLQITPQANLISYLVTRIDRSFAAARDIVHRLDKASLARKRPITRALASELLDKPF